MERRDLKMGEVGRRAIGVGVWWAVLPLHRLMFCFGFQEDFSLYQRCQSSSASNSLLSAPLLTDVLFTLDWKCVQIVPCSGQEHSSTVRLPIKM